MQFRKLGQTGLDVSAVSFGTWQLGGERWKALSEEESIGLLRHARDCGVNLFDVSVVYGQYEDPYANLVSRSQELLSRAFAGHRDQVIYCLKLGQFDEFSHRADFTPARLVAQFRQSLMRLRTDYVDICLVHAPSLHAVREGRALAILQTLQALGAVRFVGYSFENEPEHVLTALAQDINVLMIQLNLLDRQCQPILGPVADHGIGLLVGGPFKRGYLTGEFHNVEELPLEDDYWRWNLGYNRGKVEQILRRVNELLDVHLSPRALRKTALDYLLNSPAVSSAIVGFRKPAEIDECAEVSSEPCDKKEVTDA